MLPRPALRPLSRASRAGRAGRASSLLTSHQPEPISIRARRSYAASSPRPAPFPTVPTCPAPTCSCADPPPPLDGLEIDRTGKLNGVMSAYAEQVLVCTGQDDWPSRIEDDNSGDNLAADLKELFGRGGEFRDPFHNVSVLNASFPSSVPRRRADIQTSSAYLLPSFKYVPFLPRVSFDSVRALAAGFLLPEKLHAMHDGLSPIHRDRLTRKPGLQGLLYGVRDVDEVMVLICGHGGRDARCGQYGPLLRAEFERLLPEFGVGVSTGPVEVDMDMDMDEPGPGALAGEQDSTGARQEKKTTTTTTTTAVSGAGSVAARVGLISHIGGHKFAGNVIVYIPPRMRLADGGEHPLGGKGVWLGRVEPKHVEGIITETILKGVVIEDMFRGGIDQNRAILRI